MCSTDLSGAFAGVQIKEGWLSERRWGQIRQEKEILMVGDIHIPRCGMAWGRTESGPGHPPSVQTRKMLLRADDIP